MKYLFLWRKKKWYHTNKKSLIIIQSCMPLIYIIKIHQKCIILSVSHCVTLILIRSPFLGLCATVLLHLTLSRFFCKNFVVGYSLVFTFDIMCMENFRLLLIFGWSICWSNHDFQIILPLSWPILTEHYSVHMVMLHF